MLAVLFELPAFAEEPILKWNESGFLSLVESQDFAEISALEEDILEEISDNLLGLEDVEKSDIVPELIDYENAYCCFVMSDPFLLGEFSTEDWIRELRYTTHIWRIPICCKGFRITIQCFPRDYPFLANSEKEKMEKSGRSWVVGEFALNYVRYSSGMDVAEEFQMRSRWYGVDPDQPKLLFYGAEKLTGTLGVTVENNQLSQGILLDGSYPIGSEYARFGQGSVREYQIGKFYDFSEMAKRFYQVKADKQDFPHLNSISYVQILLLVLVGIVSVLVAVCIIRFKLTCE